MLRSKQFVYELVEDTNTKKKPELEVVLTAFVSGLGNRGSIVSVTQNFAYNKLLLPGLAVYKTPENIAKYEPSEETKAKQFRSSPYVERTISDFQKQGVVVVMNKSKPWVIQPWHIRVSMRQAGLYVLDDSSIELPKEPITGPDSAKDQKDFYVTVTINNLEKAKVRCRIFHWSNDPRARTVIQPDFWQSPPELLFPDDETQSAPKVDDIDENAPVYYKYR